VQQYPFKADQMVQGTDWEAYVTQIAGRGLYSPTSQLNLSRFWHKIHPKHP